ncbi:MAG: aminodeoxychorismate lyase [Gammaproteobacteria bacterium]|nr:aminodeoxychorismate lyase [Gammaproteobacteria bacterium]
MRTVPAAVLVDGEPGAPDARDRGLHYGDGLFETFAVRAGKPLCWERHMRRLARGGRRLRLAVPDAELLWREALRLCAGAERAVLKLILTRGAGQRGYRPPAAARPCRIMLCYPWRAPPREHLASGIAARVCETRLAAQPRTAGLKHLNRLEQVLAQQEWDDPRVPEGIMLDSRGRPVAGTMSNLFAIRGNLLLTPDLALHGVAGIVREMLLELAPGCGLQPRVGALQLQELQAAEESFVCNSLFGLWPLRCIDGHPVPLGPAVRRLRGELLAKNAIMPQ